MKNEYNKTSKLSFQVVQTLFDNVLSRLENIENLELACELSEEETKEKAIEGKMWENFKQV